MESIITVFVCARPAKPRRTQNLPLNPRTYTICGVFLPVVTATKSGFALLILLMRYAESIQHRPDLTITPSVVRVARIDNAVL